MTRSGFKKLWLVALMCVLGISFFVFRKASEYENQIATFQLEKKALTDELNRGSQMTADVARLDSLTVDERKTTKLDILRDLDLQDSEIPLELTSKISKDVGRIKLYTRRFRMSGVAPYAEAMEEIDRLHNTRKMVITSVRLAPAKEVYGDQIDFVIGGVIYGLEK